MLEFFQHPGILPALFAIGLSICDLMEATSTPVNGSTNDIATKTFRAALNLSLANTFLTI